MKIKGFETMEIIDAERAGNQSLLLTVIGNRVKDDSEFTDKILVWVIDSYNISDKKETNDITGEM